MNICCLDMEGVLTPEIWIEFSKKTRTKELSLTTRDLPDYDELMRRRLKILRGKGLKLKDIQRVIAGLRPLAGAKKFLDHLRAKRQVIILSDTYYEFAMPLMEKLGRPSLLCNSLSIDKDGFIADYHLRQKNGKEGAVRALKSIGFEVKAAGDSYNDITMLKAADEGILFNPPAAIAKEFPQFKVTRNYQQLLEVLLDPSASLGMT
ncbi:MAG: bifunctional phosphoserine phosphatase/homoserine phosphotransferase ThrH [Candidatus Omnitrophica bacterium]|nr:bifunctional phosphoserine phosphatase/homoserine phosphotransferase ThrH [Candidatus Omnitrophota bacterium]